MWITLILLTGFGCPAIAATAAKTYPGDTKYPSENTWRAFNQTIGGRLIIPGLKDTGSFVKQKVRVCATYDQTKYSSDPVLVKAPWWGGFGCPDCPSRYATETCSLGNHPSVVVKAHNSSDVMEAVKFANTHNLRLVIKNTGHDFLGRSIGYGSLSIWTHALKGIQWIEKWTPSGNENAIPQSAVRFGSGTQWTELYKEAYTHNKIVTGGSDGSVGAAGWILGGGHGSFTNKFGLGVDNLLEAETVLPNGELVIANEESHPELFWALRGGGGGTFGVLTRITMKAHPGESINGVRLGMTVNKNETGESGITKAVAYLLSAMPEWTDWGLSGIPIMQTWRFDGLFIAPGKASADISRFIAPHIQRIRDMGVTVNTFDMPSYLNAMTMSQGFALNAVIDGNREGGPAIMASRLLIREALSDTEAMEKVLTTMMERGYIVEPFVVGGGAVSKNKNLSASINPVWREAIIHFSILPSKQWNLKTVNEVMESYNQTQQLTFDFLDQFSSGQAAYVNEASWMEPNWQKTFFGTNYPKLLEVKKRYDPNNILWCHPCVGSEVFTRKDDGKLYLANI